MNKIITIALSFFVLLQSLGIGLCDVSQIDEFFEHAQYHSEQYGDNVIVFISKHYGELKASHEKDHQEEKEDHEQLPFQHHSHFSSVAAIVLNKQADGLRTIEVSESRLHNFFYQAPSSSLHSEGILQPPRYS